jgi:hypothetical protein
MPTAAKPRLSKFRPHVHVYLWLALLVVSVSPFIIASAMDWSDSHPLRAFGLALASAALVQLGLWLARRRCSAQELSWWEGMLAVTGYMSIGIGRISALIALPVASLAIVASMIIALLGVARGDATFAPRQFRRLVMLACRNRMYQ